MGINQAPIILQLQVPHPRCMECSDLSLGTRPRNTLRYQKRHHQIPPIYWIQVCLLEGARHWTHSCSAKQGCQTWRGPIVGLPRKISVSRKLPTKDFSSSERFPATPSPLFSNTSFLYKATRNPQRMQWYIGAQQYIHIPNIHMHSITRYLNVQVSPDRMK